MVPDFLTALALPRKCGAMRIIFMGSPEFAVPSLDALVEAGNEVVAVYAQPPRPAGRGKADRKTAVHERADELGIEVRTPRTLRRAGSSTSMPRSCPAGAERRRSSAPSSPGTRSAE